MSNTKEYLENQQKNQNINIPVTREIKITTDGKDVVIAKNTFQSRLELQQVLEYVAQIILKD